LPIIASFKVNAVVWIFPFVLVLISWNACGTNG